MPPYERWYHQSIAHWHYTIWRCFWDYGHSPYDARRYRSQNSIVAIDRRGHESYDQSFMDTNSRTIFSNRCWSRDHAYDESYDDIPPAKKTDRCMRLLLEIVANIADLSHVRQIATNRTIEKSYDPVWLWLYDWFCPGDRPRPLRPVVRSFYDLPTIPKKIRSQLCRNLEVSLVWLGLRCFEHDHRPCCDWFCPSDRPRP